MSQSVNNSAPVDVLVIPERRYAIFSSLLCGDYAVVVKGDDMRTAPNWGGFVGWLGGVKPATTRVVARIGGAV